MTYGEEQKPPVYLSTRAGMQHHTRHKGLKGMTKAELMERVITLEAYAQQITAQCIRDYEDAQAWRKVCKENDASIKRISES